MRRHNREGARPGELVTREQIVAILWTEPAAG
jgi:hypothetical protein